MQSWTDIFLICSNIFILIGVRWATKRKYYLEAYTLFQSGSISAIYHAFSIFVEKQDQTYFNALKFMDFYCAVLVLIVLSVYSMNLDNISLKPIPILFFSTVLMFLLMLSPFNYIYEIIISAACVLMVIVSYIVRKRIPRMNFKNIIITLIFIGSGLFCFHFGTDIGPYWLMHSLWHICIMTSTYFVLHIPLPDYLQVSHISASAKIQIRKLLKYTDLDEQGTELPTINQRPHVNHTSNFRRKRRSLSLNNLDSVVIDDNMDAV